MTTNLVPTKDDQRSPIQMLMAADSQIGSWFSGLNEAPGLLTGLARDPAFLDEHILPLFEEAELAEDWYVARRYDVPGGGSLQIFVWPPGTETRVHDHSSWGAVCCAVGSVFEERYERLDDGSQLEHARLQNVWQKVWRKNDGVSTVLPYDGGIHRVGNAGDGVAISVHLYGPRMSEMDDRDYDPSRDYVCDRREKLEQPVARFGEQKIPGSRGSLKRRMSVWMNQNQLPRLESIN